MADTEQTTLTKANNDTREISIKSAESDIKSMIYVIRNQQGKEIKGLYNTKSELPTGK